MYFFIVISCEGSTEIRNMIEVKERGVKLWGKLGSFWKDLRELLVLHRVKIISRKIRYTPAYTSVKDQILRGFRSEFQIWKDNIMEIFAHEIYPPRRWSWSEITDDVDHNFSDVSFSFSRCEDIKNNWKQISFF